MSQDLADEVVSRVRGYLEGRFDLESLYIWVMDHSEVWGTPEVSTDASDLALGVLAACWELSDSHSNEDEVRASIAQDLSRLPASSSAP